MAKTKEWAFPRGQEGLLSGPLAPGVGEVDQEAARRAVAARMAEADEAGEDMAALSEALEPQLEAERRAQARTEAIDQDRAKDAPFLTYLRELSELAGQEDPSEGRSELEMTLCTVEKVTGGERMTICHKERRSPDEALAEGMPDFEGIAMQYARDTGRFGAYAWKLRGWLKGEPVKQTTIRLHIAVPPGYQAPKPPTEPEVRKDPMDELTKTIALMGTLRQAMGGGNDGGNAQSAALGNALAKLEASENHRRELRDVEDRHKKELKDAEKEAYERGKADGSREAKAESERRIWELERDLERVEDSAAPVPDMIDKVIGAIGGPQALQGIVGAVLQAANKPKPALRPSAPRLVPRPARQAEIIAPPVAANPAPEPILDSANVQTFIPGQGLPEPTPEEVAEAVALLEDGIVALRESPETHHDTAGLLTVLEDFAAQGRTVSGPGVAQWWTAINTQAIPHVSGKRINWLELCEILAPEEEEPMDLEGLKALLVERLEEGRTVEAIMDELRVRVPEETRSEWRSYMAWMPMKGTLSFLKIPTHLEARAAEILEAFKAE